LGDSVIGALFILCIVMLSQSPTLARFADASGLATCFWRMVFASILVAPFALRPGRLNAFRRFSRHDFFQLLLSGFFLFVHLYFFFRAVTETSIATAIILYSINPVTTAIGAYLLFRERVSLALAASALLGVAGVAILFGENLLTAGGLGGGRPGLAVSPLWGDLWAILAAIFFSCYILTGKALRKKLPNSLFVFSISLQTALYSMLAMLVFQVPFIGYSGQTWLAFFGMALFVSLLGHAIFTYCLNYLNVNFMSCMKLVEPVLSAAVASWLFHERLTEWAAVGFALTGTSVVVLYLEPLRALIRGRSISRDRSEKGD
jgi:drug/metabolite transporter (DMT)-like permease